MDLASAAADRLSPQVSKATARQLESLAKQSGVAISPEVLRLGVRQAYEELLSFVTPLTWGAKEPRRAMEASRWGRHVGRTHLPNMAGGGRPTSLIWQVGPTSSS